MFKNDSLPYYYKILSIKTNKNENINGKQTTRYKCIISLCFKPEIIIKSQEKTRTSQEKKKD